MRITNVVVFGVALPSLASAANFMTGNRVSENTFQYDIEKCTDAKPCSLYLIRFAWQFAPRAFSLINAEIIEKQAGTEFTARIQNVPSGTYIFQATGGEDGKTTATTQFTYHTNLATTGTDTATSSSPTTSSATASSQSTSSKMTSSPPESTAASSDSSFTGTSTGPVTGSVTGTTPSTSPTGTAIVSSTGGLTSSSAVGTPQPSETSPKTSSVPGTKESSSTKTATAPSTTTTALSSGALVTFSSWEVLGAAVVMGWLLI